MLVRGFGHQRADTHLGERAYTLFVIDLATRAVHIAGTTISPDAAFMKQIVRNRTAAYAPRATRLRNDYKGARSVNSPHEPMTSRNPCVNETPCEAPGSTSSACR